MSGLRRSISESDILEDKSEDKDISRFSGQNIYNLDSDMK